MFNSGITDCKDSSQITRAYLDSLLVEARYIDSTEPDLSFDLYGASFTSPLMTAAFSHLDGYHANGMVEMAKGAEKAGSCNWAGYGTEQELLEIMQVSKKTIKIVKPYADRKRLLSMIEYAESVGVMAVGIDIDHGFGHDGRPDVIRGVNMHPLSFEELKTFRGATSLPFIVKGVLSLQDAEKCAKANVTGVVISHHHGIIPCAVPPLRQLPAIKERFGDCLDLFVDCGINDGIDAFKALALGAKAVCIGRSILPVLHDNGADGIYKAFMKMQDELRNMMAKTCSPDVNHISKDVLHMTL